MKRVLFIGFSHIHALAGASKLDGLESETIILHPTEKFQPWSTFGPDGSIAYNRAIADEVKSVAATFKADAIVGSLWGNQHFVFSCANHPRRFDFVLPDDLKYGLDPAAEIIPYEAILAAFRERCLWTAGVAPFIRSVTELPIFMLSAPPPLDSLHEEPNVTGKEIVDLVREYGKAPPALRYKSWQVCDRIYREFCAGEGFKFLPPPNGTMHEGFRLKEYAGRDWLHANADYGTKVLEQVLGALQ